MVCVPEVRKKRGGEGDLVSFGCWSKLNSAKNHVEIELEGGKYLNGFLEV